MPLIRSNVNRTFTGTTTVSALTATGVLSATGDVVNLIGNSNRQIPLRIFRDASAGDSTNLVQFYLGNSGTDQGAIAFQYTNAAASGAPRGRISFQPRNNAGTTNIAPAGLVFDKTAGADTATASLFVTAGSVLVNADGTVTLSSLAGSGSRAVNADANGVLSAASDSRLKVEQPKAELPGLKEVLKLQPRAYKWKSDIERRKDKASVEVGFFADEVAPIIPSAAPKSNDGYYGFYDRSVTAALVKAVQELHAEVQALKK